MKERDVQLNEELANLHRDKVKSGSLYGLLLCIVLGVSIVILGVRNSPKPVSADDLKEETLLSEVSSQKQNVSFNYKTLPVDPNRHNRLAHNFMSESPLDRPVIFIEHREECQEPLPLPKLKLKAIVWGEKASAVINEHLVEEGQTLSISNNPNEEIEVIDIRRTSVLLQCNHDLIELRLTDK